MVRHGVIVTGAAQGIGKATAMAFADVGARVCAIDLREDDVRAVVEALPGGPHQAVAMDLNDLDRHAGRMRFMETQLDALGVPIEPIAGVQPCELTLPVQ